MKRLITLLLALVLAFTVTGCKKKPAETSTPETTSSSNTQSDITVPIMRVQALIILTQNLQVLTIIQL